ncbi:hypothetical protein DFH11DRAFT_1579466 [Phellopilus nigrolimitatus]|nr:hypothetical protein DFH11DRAFT_1579466 [Phellopilus nigrolimitatus]
MSDDEDVSFYGSDDIGGFDDYDDDEDSAVLATRVDKGKGVDLSIQHTSFNRPRIDRVVSILDIDRGLALIFLLHYRWDRDKLIESYTDAPARVLNAVGELPGPLDYSESVEDKYVSNPPNKRLLRSTSPPDATCGVCFDDIVEPSGVPEIKCKHRFCRDCWGGYLSSKVKDEGQCSLRCMAEKCKTALKEDFIQAVVDNEVYYRWQALIAQSFVSATSSLRFCPAPSCTETVHCSISSSALLTTVPTVSCIQKHEFCFGCGLESGHMPVICKIATQWLESKEDSGTTQWINANTRKCPQCSNSIEKAGGCNRMLCHHCRFQFCWMCLKDWSVHGYNDTVCNSFVEPPRTATMDAAKMSLERWLFYYDRFSNHELSARLDQELVVRTQEKMLAIQESSDLSWIETYFMQHAVDELTRCRRTLKWTYAMAHFLASGNKKQMFEDIQADLEKAVERLSQLIDEPIEDTSAKDLRQRVMDKTVYVQKRHEVMLVDVARGLAEGHWDWMVPLD